MRPESNLFGFWRVANEEDRVRDWRAYADDIRKRAFLRGYMEARERELAAPKHPCEGMSLEEIFSFVTFLQKRLEEESARNEDIKNRLDNVFDQLVKSQKTNESNAKALVRLVETSESLKEQLILITKERDRLLKENESKESRDYRKGMTYNTMNAHTKRIHRCNERMLPDGCVIIRREFRKVFDRVSYIVEHDYEYITYRMPDGSIRSEYFPVSKEDEQVQFVPGTHATPDLLANLAFNKYCIFTPLYREMNRFANESMQINRQTLTNWLGKGASYLERLFPALKEMHELKMVPETLGDQMRKAVNYLDSYWSQIFNYLNDGRYSIDNSIAQQCIRPLTRERANSLHYASHKGAEVSAIYHTFISTCKMVGVSALDYMKKAFSELLTGSNDYAGLLPHTIALK